MPLPRSEGRGPAEAVALKFSPDYFRRDLREKDLKPIVLDVIDQAYSARILLFGGLGALGVLKIGQAFLKASDVGRIVCEGVIREADPAGKIRFEEFEIVSSEKPRSARPSRSALRMSRFARFITPCRFFRRSLLSTSFSVASGSSEKIARLDSSAVTRRR